MKYWKIILIIAIIVGVGIFGVYYYKFFYSWKECCADFCSSTTGYDNAVESGNINNCNSLIPLYPELDKKQGYENYCREFCIRKIAINQKNPNLCNLITNLKTEWLPENERKVAFSIKGSCYTELIHELKSNSIKDILFCERIDDSEFWKSKCQDVICMEGGEPDINYLSSYSKPISFSSHCCEGLKYIRRIKNLETCESVQSGEMICSNCGNNLCEQWENKCNCPADCF